MAFRLGVNESIEHAVRRVAHEQIRGALQDLDCETADWSRAVHDARRRCKKLRALLRLVAPAMGATFESEDAAIRGAARHLSVLRDAHVLLATVESLRRLPGFDVHADAALGSLRDSCMAQHQQTDLGDRPDGDGSLRRPCADGVDRFIADITALQGRVDRWSLSATDFKAISEGLRATYRRARRAMKRAVALPSPEHLHEWRRHAKHHQYHMQLMLDLWPRMMQARYDELKELTDALGEDHDLALLRKAVTVDVAEHAATPPLATAPGCSVTSVLAVIDRRRAELQATAIPLGRRLFSDKPREFTSRMRTLWHLWHENHAQNGLLHQDQLVAAEPSPEIRTISIDLARESETQAPEALA